MEELKSEPYLLVDQRQNNLKNKININKQTPSEELLTEFFNRQSHQNLTSPRRCEMRLIKSLKEDESIMVLPADKGRASVVMDTATYRAKISTLIENGPYQLLNKDPTDRLTRKLSEKLLTLKRNGHLSEAVYNKIRPRHKQPPRIYGLPKIHMADVPLRPIVSCVNTFAL